MLPLLLVHRGMDASTLSVLDLRVGLVRSFLRVLAFCDSHSPRWGTGRLEAMHDWIDSALALLTLAVCGLTSRFLNRIEAMESTNSKFAKELRDVRSDCAHIRGKLGLAPFPYQGD